MKYCFYNKYILYYYMNKKKKYTENTNIIIYLSIILFFILYYKNFTWKIICDYLSFHTCFILFSLIFSLIVYKKITLLGYFFGFIIQWIIFLNVNPYPINQNNKLTIMNLIPDKFKPTLQFSLYDINEKYLQNNLNIQYPIIIKPIICSGGGKNIEIINSDKELKIYLLNCTNKSNFMVQNYLDNYNVEIGVLWEKQPWWKEGKVIEIVEKTQKNEIRPFDDNNYKNHQYLINKKINGIFNNISKNIQNMNVCRYDIRLKNITDLENENFKIIEVNGTMGMEFLGYPIKYGFMVDVNWYFRRLIIGLYNILTLHGYSPITLLIVMYKSYYNSIICKDWENIYSYYS